MKTVYIYKAEPIGDQVIESVGIRITECLNTGALTTSETRARHQEEAQRLFDALYNSLPGGVFDRLAGLMLQKIASGLIVSHASLERFDKQAEGK